MIKKQAAIYLVLGVLCCTGPVNAMYSPRVDTNDQIIAPESGDATPNGDTGYTQGNGDASEMKKKPKPKPKPPKPKPKPKPPVTKPS